MNLLNLIQEKNNSALFKRALDNPNWNFPFLAEIATDKLPKMGIEDKTVLWMKYRDEEREKENNSEKVFRNNKEKMDSRYNQSYIVSSVIGCSIYSYKYIGR